LNELKSFTHHAVYREREGEDTAAYSSICVMTCDKQLGLGGVLKIYLDNTEQDTGYRILATGYWIPDTDHCSPS
jgi:hypothetical protein